MPLPSELREFLPSDMERERAINNRYTREMRNSMLDGPPDESARDMWYGTIERILGLNTGDLRDPLKKAALVAKWDREEEKRRKIRERVDIAQMWSRPAYSKRK